MRLASPFAKFITPPVIDRICLAREEVMGYAGRISRLEAFIDDVIVFGVFLMVRSPLQQSSSFSEGIEQNRYLPIGYQIWHLYGEWDRRPPLPRESTLCQPRYSEL
jgi:hypothetical protein